jgi:thiamine phosphate synthase YjbQ (UPF0047 family)
MIEPSTWTLQLTPRSRCDAIDVARRLADEVGDAVRAYARVLYCSHHTTAGYLEQGISRRLVERRGRLDPFFGVFQRLFPEGAGYRHDELELRQELSAEQRLNEPKNADAHLTFIGSGLQNCVTYINEVESPVYFMDLDGVNEGRARTRTTSIVAYDHEEVVAEQRYRVPVSKHPIDSVNLADERLGLAAALDDMVRGADIGCGRIDIELDAAESDAALTVNEFETLLMRYDLAEVLQDPLRFVARQGRRILRDPRAVPAKSLGYAKYDLVQVMKEAFDTVGLSESAIERVVARLMAFPAARMLRLKRRVSLAVGDLDGTGPRVVHGRYQSPILLQWCPSSTGARAVNLSLKRFL